MSTAIVDATISGDLKAAPDQIWEEQALASTGTITSDEFLLGQTMGGVEVKVVVVDGATLAGSVTISLNTSDESGGTFTTQITKTIASATVLAEGDEIARFILPREISDQMYTVVEIVTSADDSAVTVDSYMVYVR